MRVDTVLMVDWSAGNEQSVKPKADAIWYCVARGGTVDAPVYCRNRQVAEAEITVILDAEHAAGRRVLAGFDFAFGYPEGFGERLTGSDDPFAIWEWFAARVTDRPKTNNRFDLANEINRTLGTVGPFWGHPQGKSFTHLPMKRSDRSANVFLEKRKAERLNNAKSVWQLAYNGAVGSQVIMGLPFLNRLRLRFSDDLAVWPFQPLDRQIALVEIWPSLIDGVVKDTIPEGKIKDAHQVEVLARTVARLSPDALARMLDTPATPEGWIFGLGHEAALEQAARDSLAPPKLKNDCFAMPQGAHWTPVDEALAHLRTHLGPVAEIETVPLAAAARRFAAADITAARSHPPAPNAAVDGYGFAGPAPEGVNTLPLLAGRAAAGAPYPHAVPAGHAIRILTGANLPEGVDTVILQEDVRATHDTLRFHGPLKIGANARKAGEDMQADAVILTRGRRLSPGDIGMLAAAGIGQVQVHRPLRVGILSTGDELVRAGDTAHDGQIFDANGPMLTALVAGWGYDAIPLGRAPDDRQKLGAMLDDAATRCDVILTSGGASAGDEDHVSALLSETGSFALWRIAMKPGRPLVMGVWQGKPVFGLPGNPVAAMVCGLVFGAPALRVMAGGDWTAPQGYLLPAAFAKSKKEGRSEYLRARVTEGQVAVFPSEGSGRVSGLSWATGLVALDPAALTINPGDPVRYIPFADFGA